MSNEATGTLQTEGALALARMEEALELLDRCASSAEIAGHLDLAICRLREAIAQDPATRLESAPPQHADFDRHDAPQPSNEAW